MRLRFDFGGLCWEEIEEARGLLVVLRRGRMERLGVRRFRGKNAGGAGLEREYVACGCVPTCGDDGTKATGAGVSIRSTDGVVWTENTVRGVSRFPIGGAVCMG
jgi:hypothetical protein